MKLSAGCDVGSLTSKVVLMRKGRIIGASVIKSGIKPRISAEDALQSALYNAGASRNEIACCIGTGYGRDKIAFVDGTMSEIACHAKGAQWLMPSARTVIDIGGQDCKVMRLDAAAKVLKFNTNDKCASGTGRFLELMARVLNVGIDTLGTLSAGGKTTVRLASTCTVWAQADVIRYLNAGYAIEDIGTAVNAAMANRVATLVNTIRVERDVVMTGGVAKNSSVVSILARILGQRLKKIRRADPQMAGAIGAALVADETLNGGPGR